MSPDHLGNRLIVEEHGLLGIEEEKEKIGNIVRSRDVKNLHWSVTMSIRNKWLARDKNANTRRDEAFELCRINSFLISRATFHSQDTTFLHYFTNKSHQANHFILTKNQPTNGSESSINVSQACVVISAFELICCSTICLKTVLTGGQLPVRHYTFVIHTVR